MSGSSREEGRIARDGAKEQGGPLEHVLAFAAGGSGQRTWRLRRAKVEGRLRRKELPGAKACCVSCYLRTPSPNCLTELLLCY